MYWVGYARTIVHVKSLGHPKAPGKSAAQLQITRVSEYVEIHTLRFLPLESCLCRLRVWDEVETISKLV